MKIFKKRSHKPNNKIRERSNVCFSYCRVSTSRQAREGVSLAEQKAAAEDYHNRHLSDEYQWGGHYIDPAVTSKVPIRERPAGSAMLARIQPYDMVLATRLDRPFRSLVDAVSSITDWHRRGINCHFIRQPQLSLDGTPVSKLVFQLIATVSEFERDIIVERTAEGVQHRIFEGRIPREQLPFGCTLNADDRATACTEELEYMQLCHTACETMTQQEAANYLHRHKVMHPRLKRTLISGSLAGALAIRYQQYLDLQAEVFSGEIDEDDLPRHFQEVIVHPAVKRVEESLDGECKAESERVIEALGRSTVESIWQSFCQEAT